MAWLDDWIRQKWLYGDVPQQPTDQWSQDALAAQGGIDPRVMENGVPDFHTPEAQAGLLGAKTLGFMTDPTKMAGLLGAAAFAAKGFGGPPPAAPTFRGHKPPPQGPGADAIKGMYAGTPRERKKIRPGDNPFAYYDSPFDGSY